MSRCDKRIEKDAIFAAQHPMQHEYRGYVFSIDYAAKDPGYLVDFPDIPEIITSGPTLDAAFANACEALDLRLESLQKPGISAPVARHRLFMEAR